MKCDVDCTAANHPGRNYCTSIVQAKCYCPLASYRPGTDTLLCSTANMIQAKYCPLSKPSNTDHEFCWLQVQEGHVWDDVKTSASTLATKVLSKDRSA